MKQKEVFAVIVMVENNLCNIRILYFDFPPDDVIPGNSVDIPV